MQKTIKCRVCAFLLLAATLLGALLCCLPLQARAASQYSSVLSDLKRDKNFKAEDYPADENDVTVRVIQIAEGDDGELFLYVYQPGAEKCERRATYINMSLQNRTERSPSYNLYSLTWLNSDGVFAKYIVNDFKVKNDQYRYYNIAAVYRAWDAQVDAPAAEADDIVGHVGFEVGNCFCVYYYNDLPVYENEKVNVVDIDIKAVGIVRYTEGFKFYLDKCDSHFVAFSVENFNVDKIYDATIVYTTQTYSFLSSQYGLEEKYGDPITDEHEISDKEKGNNTGDGLFGVKYTWDRILSVDAFEKQLEDFKNEDITFTEGGLGSAQYVFQFLETDYEVAMGEGWYSKELTKVTNVGVLRLHFLSEGKVYNLGVVSDLVSDDGIPDYEITIGDNFENQEWWQKIMMILCLILLVTLLTAFAAPIGAILKIFVSGLGFILKFALWVLTLPFKVLIFAFGRKR